MEIKTKLNNLTDGKYIFQEAVLILLDKILTELKEKSK